MQLSNIDWGIIIGFFIITLLIGLAVSRKAGKNSSEFFLSGRNMPWWLLGVSMVATTFAADTPNLVAGIVRKDGIAGNWVWWAFLLTGMVTVFIYAKLWRKLGISTDLEYYEIRYKGKAAAFLRGFRAVYLGVFFNVVIMATVCLAGVKIGHTMLGLSAFETLGIASVVTVLYSLLGGLKGVILTDFFQFIIAMVGSIWAAYFIIDMPEIGGMEGLLSNELVQEKLNFVPTGDDSWDVWITLLIIPLAVQWWSVWYPGAEPGGGGYIAQRMLAAKDEKHATAATLFFNFAHYALRPWPWIIIALASLILFPTVADMKAQFPGLEESLYQDDLAYPAMLTYLPAGLLGLVLASLISAFMSTISTHLNWGSSYVVNDFYKRFMNPYASEKELVFIGRISTVVMMALAALLSVVLEQAKEAFDLILTIGAGTGLLFILRWFWKAINPYSEITAMTVSFLVAISFFIADKGYGLEYSGNFKLLMGVGITTAAWVTVTFLTMNDKYLNPEFEVRAFESGNKFKNMGYKVLSMVFGCIGIYAALFATGNYLLGDPIQAIYFGLVFAVSAIIIASFWKKLFA
ncbi:sodium:solute symporter family protein [Crocinitomix catalasitica]|uniref:sodium:solute symporter family protein n=1 Tax=Crocinitomix catalasitica TaxID=184607 RepID=UPI000487E48A|nr:sodium:solute symporter family protein [Crocinitomix catalasitica]